jgi:hypothetical protein
MQTDDPVEKHAKWIFTSATVIGTLGTAFGLFNALATPGRVAIAIAVVLLGFSLALATFVLSPAWDTVWAQVPSFTQAVALVITARKKQLRWASGLFAAALVVAALSPLLTITVATAPPTAAITFGVDSSGVLTAHLSGSRLPAFSVGELDLSTASDVGPFLPSARGRADSLGTLQLTLPAARIPEGVGSLTLHGAWRVPGAAEPAWQEQVTLEPPPSRIP